MKAYTGAPNPHAVRSWECHRTAPGVGFTPTGLGRRMTPRRSPPSPLLGGSRTRPRSPVWPGWRHPAARLAGGGAHGVPGGRLPSVARSDSPRRRCPSRLSGPMLAGMDITDASPQRRRLGIERFVAGEESLAYEGVVFWREPEGFLVVASYSVFIHLENVTPEEATREIERSKQILGQLRGESPEFETAVSGLSHKFEFCFDQSTGAVKVATLQNGALKWLR